MSRSTYEAAEGGAHVGPGQLVLEEPRGEKVDVARGVVEGGEFLPGLGGNVARRLIPGAGPLHATSLDNTNMYSLGRVDITLEMEHGPNGAHWPRRPMRPVFPFPVSHTPYPHCKSKQKYKKVNRPLICDLSRVYALALCTLRGDSVGRAPGLG